jgi:hypothetical protein
VNYNWPLHFHPCFWRGSLPLFAKTLLSLSLSLCLHYCESKCDYIEHNDKDLHSGERNVIFKVTVFCDDEKRNGHFTFLLKKVIKGTANMMGI